MTTISVAPKRGLDAARYQGALIILLLLAVAVITRAGRIGDPSIQMDEQFYLLVADRMWHGALPYVDIWDRKPILLFLIYAGLRPFSANGIVAYQIGALLFATLTAYFVVLIARRFANPGAAVLAGMAYLIYLPLLGGEGGQSPVFYNLFLAIGAWEVLRAGEACDPAGLRRHGWRGMLWAGLAIQVKYTAAIDGIAFGLWLIVLLVRRQGRLSAPVLVQAASWALVALAPTLAATGFYVLIGHGWQFVQANFLSILQKHEAASFSDGPVLRATLLQLTPLLTVAIFSIVKASRSSVRREAQLEAPWPFLALWTVCAMVDFFAIGNYYDHYALPLLMPVIVLCAPLLGTAVAGVTVIALFAWCVFLKTGLPTTAWKTSDEARIAAMAQAAQPYTAQGCIYLNDGPPIVYLLTHSCLPTRYVFPSHLNEAAEARATDASRNMAALIERHPTAIFVADKPLAHTRNPATAALLDAALARDYARVATLPDVYPQSWQILYVRKDLLPQNSAPSAPAGRR
ncbi:MAG TPA: hypothetical protein VHY10_08980 [Xanthobacteraceae bacterium]|nr:hypothetical protein [Xanthobacteraceae bacterium]